MYGYDTQCLKTQGWLSKKKMKSQFANLSSLLGQNERFKRYHRPSKFPKFGKLYWKWSNSPTLRWILYLAFNYTALNYCISDRCAPYVFKIFWFYLLFRKFHCFPSCIKGKSIAHLSWCLSSQTNFVDWICRFVTLLYERLIIISFRKSEAKWHLQLYMC